MDYYEAKETYSRIGLLTYGRIILATPEVKPEVQEPLFFIDDNATTLEHLKSTEIETTLETSGEDVELHSKRYFGFANEQDYEKMMKERKMKEFEYGENNKGVDLLHSFRVYFYVFPTRFKCIFTSFPLVSSVV